MCSESRAMLQKCQYVNDKNLESLIELVTELIIMSMFASG